ncbi:AMP-binding protein [Falsochrobactrum sp. TDYN1]|uniref:AMP-binding protein n=1 Tax=Falsochrobactrum tianjinense TaxID=2706015 RepID=A0A949PNM7_9HYPH|nr:AMP-binding protein [Falsochrobactrum sp. TDYN1]MBV2143650.1 AMP-binding protein [Falsochrobactrum sp. TDYN1]
MHIHGLVRSFLNRAQNNAQTTYATLNGQLCSFGDLYKASEALGCLLAEAGTQPGDRIVVMMPNSPYSLALVFALLRRGLVWVPVNPALVGSALDNVFRTTEPKLAFCEEDVVGNVQESAKTTGTAIHIVTETAFPEYKGEAPATDLPRPEDLAAIMFTSGTTGPAKGVMVTHMMLELACQSVALCTDIKPGDRFFMWEPFYHIGGAQVILLPLFKDITLTVAERFSASQFWKKVSETGCTHIHHLGGIVQILLKQPESPYDRNHKVRVAWGGGCAPSVWRAFEERFGVQIRECYGMTECSSLTTYNDENIVGSVGRPLPYFNVRLVDESGRVLGPDGGKGEIVVSTTLPGAITAGYYRNEQATAKAVRPDGFYTGDLGSWDKEGHLFFHGRIGDSIRCKGENVSAYEVESVANRHPDIEEAALVGVKAEIGEYDIHLFVEPRSGTTPDPHEIWSWLSDHLAPYQRPRYISVVDRFPRTPSQRIQKHLLEINPETRWEAPQLVKGKAS